MNKQKKILLSIGILVFAILLFLLGYFTGKNTNDNKKETSNITETSTPMVSETPEASLDPDETIEPIESTEAPDTTIENTSDTWTKEASYNGGDQVTYKGAIFKAKWWTQGDQPDPNDKWGVWELVGSTETIESETTPPVESPQDEVEETDKVTTPNKNSKFKIVGYYPDWKPGKVDDIVYKELTHINYSFAVPTNDSTIRPFDNPEAAKKIIKNGHKNGVKVLIAVGGWSYNDTPLEPTFIAATETDAKCKKLANNILKVVDDYGFDGVDMDWEHPRVDGSSKDQYLLLMKYLREGLDKRKKLLTSAVLAGVSADGNVLWDSAAHTDKVLNYVDWINVMAYDGGDGERHSPYDFAVNSANYWLKKRKLPKDKVVLGVPFYARPSWAGYSDILSSDASASSKDIINYNGMEAHYNGISTIKKKTNWALKNAGGIMIWEISQDTTDTKKSLLHAIYSTVHK